eukprot:CAMPEP_0206526572 /NCGR_PEP_ID=MMETSP0325_2-20121206/819_1 /ASSEMBLY_ACC=CAM_ASM_000347 /TAXON_ID=2866 /ORGANISM="Crypthecodinium cohnii, Strain Seligo" /LENGTH=140 /DNA_ID=CAMNT_0054021789 /DNA_START=255 /DNA_END=673 /DNA_ORIENTATION=-
MMYPASNLAPQTQTSYLPEFPSAAPFVVPRSGAAAGTAVNSSPISAADATLLGGYPNASGLTQAPGYPSSTFAAQPPTIHSGVFTLPPPDYSQTPTGANGFPQPASNGFPQPLQAHAGGRLQNYDSRGYFGYGAIPPPKS